MVGFDRLCATNSLCDETHVCAAGLRDMRVSSPAANADVSEYCAAQAAQGVEHWVDEMMESLKVWKENRIGRFFNHGAGGHAGAGAAVVTQHGQPYFDACRA